MNKFEVIVKDRNNARKSNDELRKKVLTDMIDSIQKSALTKKGHIEITDDLVDKTLIKYKKTIQEMIDTCPVERKETLKEYNKTMEIVKEYTPNLIEDEKEIMNMIIMTLSALSIPLEKNKKGIIMRVLSEEFKNKADMKTVNKIVNDLIN